MKKHSSIGLALAMLCAVLPPAFAAVIVPTTQPNNGFIQTPSPEWAVAHEVAPSDAPQHRQYHQAGEVALVQWYVMHAPEKGTFAYARMRREMLQERNMLHRQYHMGLDARVSSVSSRSRASSSRASLMQSASSIQWSEFSSFSSSSSVSSSSSRSSSFSSSSVSQASQSSVALGAASTYAVLAGSTVTNTGMTSVTGDLGVNPGSAVTGFGPGVVTSGSIHAADTSAAAAQTALTIAYNDLAGRTLAPVSVSGNLGGMTLSPGLYKSTSGLEISSGDLTLDAKGDANAIFIFQTVSTLNVTTGRQVILIGGAKASNVFWQVGTSATLDANAVFKGSILADQSISVKTGANGEGRLLARIGGVTLQGNTVTIPSN